jgi:hypothetical protein
MKFVCISRKKIYVFILYINYTTKIELEKLSIRCILYTLLSKGWSKLKLKLSSALDLLIVSFIELLLAMTKPRSRVLKKVKKTGDIIYQQVQCMYNLIFRCIHVTTVLYIFKTVQHVANIDWTMQQVNWSVQKGNNWRLESRHVFFQARDWLRQWMLPKFQYEVEMKTTVIGSANILFIWVLKCWYKTHIQIYIYIYIYIYIHTISFYRIFHIYIHFCNKHLHYQQKFCIMVCKLICHSNWVL